MTVLTGTDGQLLYTGRKIAKCRTWTLTVDRPLIETTTLAEYDKNYVPGIRSASGTAVCLYQPTDNALTDCLNTIFENNPKGGEEVTFVFNRKGTDLNRIKETEVFLDRGSPFPDDRIRQMPTRFRMSAYITNVSHPVNVGEAQAITLQFQACGPIEGRW